MAETATHPAASEKPKKVNVEIELDQMYMIGAARYGPGKVNVTDPDHAEMLEAAVERNTGKFPMGEDEAHERPDGSMTIMHPETRIEDTVFVRQAIGDAIMEGGGPDRAEKENVERTEEAKKSRDKTVKARASAKKGNKPAPAKQEERKQPGNGGDKK